MRSWHVAQHILTLFVLVFAFLVVDLTVPTRLLHSTFSCKVPSAISVRLLAPGNVCCQSCFRKDTMKLKACSIHVRAQVRMSIVQLSCVCLSVDKLKKKKTNNKEDSGKEETVLVYRCQCLCNVQSVTYKQRQKHRNVSNTVTSLHLPTAFAVSIHSLPLLPPAASCLSVLCTAHRSRTFSQHWRCPKLSLGQ